MISCHSWGNCVPRPPYKYRITSGIRASFQRSSSTNLDGKTSLGRMLSQSGALACWSKPRKDHTFKKWNNMILGESGFTPPEKDSYFTSFLGGMIKKENILNICSASSHQPCLSQGTFPSGSTSWHGQSEYRSQQDIPLAGWGFHWSISQT